MTAPPGTPARQPQPAAPPAEVEELLGVLAGMQELLQRLSDLAGQKLDAMRRADAEGLHSCTTMEQRLLAEVVGQQRRRDAVLARLGQLLRGGGPAGLTLAELAERLPQPSCSTLRARSGALREIAAALQRKNRLAASVARNLHSQLRGIFAELARSSQEPLGYGPQGRQEPATQHAWVDAVG